MVMVLYDGSFEGWLTAVFEIYEYKLADVQFAQEHACNLSMFHSRHTVQTNAAKARRVWQSLVQRNSIDAANAVYHTFLSEQQGIDAVLLRYMQHAFKQQKPVETDYSHPSVITVIQTDRKVRREKHRMEAFIRFQLTGDGLYYAIAEPDYNVLPLISRHFEQRYADQRWVIYDGRRKYGIYYDLKQVSTVQMQFSQQVQASAIQQAYDENEQLYQQLWQRYFSSVNIKARKNTRLHLQHMPRRYWRYLPEKMPEGR
ncbi:TIGR03915 family putative DNA repair protein [Deminuibacter soli]|uniref:DNA metabolism protein n=1 Tax=Deminuibacter soli TaxID=2291815 RepID=A0A3E1NES8_9BACT|nr:TIGR03915 family putative DNA repair protein [Deminuibacter soli]RFM26304.1 DNA metabolism protein [Deminuibacter soli]